MDSVRLDEVTQLVQDAELAVAVLGAGEEFELIPLVPLDSKPNSEIVSDAQRRGFGFAGVLCILRNGQAAAKCADIDAVPLMIRAADAFSAEAAQHALRRATSDGADWLARLYQLKDPRSEN